MRACVLAASYLQEAGIPAKLAPTIGIAVDFRRRNRSLEGLQVRNVGHHMVWGTWGHCGICDEDRKALASWTAVLALHKTDSNSFGTDLAAGAGAAAVHRLQALDT